MTMKELKKKIELLENRVKSLEDAIEKMFKIVTALNNKIDVKMETFDEVKKDLSDRIEWIYNANEINDEMFDAIERDISTINDMMKDYKLTRAYVHTLVGFLNDIGVHIVIK